MATQPVRMKAKTRETPARAAWPLSALIRMPRPARQAIAALLYRLPQGRLRRALFMWFVQAAMDAISRQDMRMMRAFAAPDFEARIAPELVALVGHDGPVVRGPEAVAAFMDAWYESWGNFTLVLKEAVDLGDGRLLLLNHARATGASSGLALGDQPEAELWEIRNGLAVSQRQWLSWQEALEAVGLSE